MRTAFAMSDLLLIALGGGLVAAFALPLRWLTRAGDAHAAAPVQAEPVASADDGSSFAAPAMPVAEAG